MRELKVSLPVDGAVLIKFLLGLTDNSVFKPADWHHAFGSPRTVLLTWAGGSMEVPHLLPAMLCAHQVIFGPCGIEGELEFHHPKSGPIVLDLAKVIDEIAREVVEDTPDLKSWTCNQKQIVLFKPKGDELGRIRVIHAVNRGVFEDADVDPPAAAELQI